MLRSMTLILMISMTVTFMSGKVVKANLDKLGDKYSAKDFMAAGIICEKVQYPILVITPVEVSNHWEKTDLKAIDGYNIFSLQVLSPEELIVSVFESQNTIFNDFIFNITTQEISSIPQKTSPKPTEDSVSLTTPNDVIPPGHKERTKNANYLVMQNSLTGMLCKYNGQNEKVSETETFGEGNGIAASFLNEDTAVYTIHNMPPLFEATKLGFGLIGAVPSQNWFYELKDYAEAHMMNTKSCCYIYFGDSQYDSLERYMYRIDQNGTVQQSNILNSNINALSLTGLSIIVLPKQKAAPYEILIYDTSSEQLFDSVPIKINYISEIDSLQVIEDFVQFAYLNADQKTVSIYLKFK